MRDVTPGPLSAYTTLGLGGPARRLVTATNRAEIVDQVRGCDAAGAPLWLLAGGSNVVIADEGLPGTVVLLRSAGVRIDRARDDHVWLTAEAGQPWDSVVAHAVTEGLAGIECLSGIPGSAGATPIQNVGAYGQEVAQTVTGVRVFDRRGAAVRELSPAECAFAYRSSRLRRDDRFVVLAVTFRLRRSPLSAPLRYSELCRRLGVGEGGRARLDEVRAAVLALRAGKAMVIDPADPDTRSVGSFFVNPVLGPAEHAVLVRRSAESVGAEPVCWPGPDGAVKVSAAWLIERAGYGKGYQGGHRGVAVSAKHALALTHRGGGSTAALLGLAREIRDGVAKTFDVALRPEPVLLNCAL